MDGKRFDELTRAMGAGASRRRVLKGLAAGVGGGLVALVGRRAPGALAAATGEPCTASADCTNGDYCGGNPRVCIAPCRSDADCGVDGVCETGHGICFPSCTTNADCTGAGEKCNPDLGGCQQIQCGTDADCNVAGNEVCNGRHQCTCPSQYIPCRAGLCCPPDSSCPSDGGTICTGGGNGTGNGGNGTGNGGNGSGNGGDGTGTPECAADTDCPGTQVCAEGGTCVPQCADDSDCAAGDVCTDGSCVAAETGGNESGDGGDTSGGGGTSGGGMTLPSTGVGGSKDGASSWLGAAAIGGAAAFLAGKKLRQDAKPTDSE